MQSMMDLFTNASAADHALAAATALGWAATILLVTYLARRASNGGRS